MERTTHHSRYLREQWRSRDRLAVLSSISLIVVAVLARRYAGEAIAYAPLPEATMPAFRPWSIGMVVLLIVPAVIVAATDRRPDRTHMHEHEQALS
jgi:hypothetical protein